MRLMIAGSHRIGFAPVIARAANSAVGTHDVPRYKVASDWRVTCSESFEARKMTATITDARTGAHNGGTGRSMTPGWLTSDSVRLPRLLLTCCV